MSTAVSCESVTKTFGGVRAVDAASLEVRTREIAAILGPSGCGKTTLLRLVAGLERPDSGRISVAGREVAGPGVWVQPERRGVGMVFQEHALFGHLTVAGNVGYGLPRAERSGPRVRELLDLVGLAGTDARTPHELSGGQQQRVALARALAPRPEIVLLDEPFSGLDAALREEIRGEVREILRTAGATAIVVTHDQEEALSMADRVSVMRSGKIVQTDTPDGLYTRPADRFVAAFVGGANVLEGSCDGRVVRCALGAVELADGVPAAGRVTVAVRPESVLLSPDGEAVVVRTTYYGHDQVIEVTLPDGTAVRSRTGPGRRFAEGSRVRVDVEPGAAIAFPALQVP